MADTADGVACICGDVIYDINDQLVNPWFDQTGYVVLADEPTITGNHSTSIRAELGAMKKLINNVTFICPTHDRPARLLNGKVVGRLHDRIPGPMSQVSTKRNWFRV